MNVQPRLAIALLLSMALVASPFARPALAADIGVIGTKLGITDTTVKNGKSKIIFISKDASVVKGPPGGLAQISGELEVFYISNPANGSFFSLPQPWSKNTATIAKFSNTLAPGGPSAAKLAIVKPGKLAKASTKSKGAIDISTPPVPGGALVVLTVYNAVDGSQTRMCSRFSTGDGSIIIHRSIAAGTGWKLTLKNGVPAPCPIECADGFENANETDVDCGGPDCAQCNDGQGCSVAGDCTSGVCTGNICQVPTCSDTVENGDETDVDCGGSCPACPDGDDCAVAADCQSGVCTGNICQVPTCSDTVENGDETDVDCGGSCSPCSNGEGCSIPADCTSGVCTGNICQPPICGDGVQNQDETDVDCGGTVCAPCGDGDGCSVAGDCTSGVCTGNICQAPTCSDGVENGTETDVDCGGGSCGPCANGDSCGANSDCQSLVCSGGICQVPTCSDSTRNGTETDVDCGGPSCPDCGPGQMCSVGSDCTSTLCSGGFCTTANCFDGARNQNESDVDCGGVCADCGPGDTCNTGADCTSFICSGGLCTTPTCSDGVKNQNESDVDCGGVCADCALNRTCNSGSDCQTNVCSGGLCKCGNQVFTFTVNSNSGGVFDSAEWPGGTAAQNGPTGCSVTINRPNANIDLVCTLASPFSVNTFAGYSTCFGSGGEDGDGCAPQSCPPAGIGSCCSTRPSCSAALNGSGAATYRVQCNQ